MPQDHLTTANSLSLAAAYGTFPFASLLFALLAGVSAWLGSIAGASTSLEIDQMALAFYVDVCHLPVLGAGDAHRLRVRAASPSAQRRPTIPRPRPAGVPGQPFEELKRGLARDLRRTTRCGP